MLEYCWIVSIKHWTAHNMYIHIEIPWSLLHAFALCLALQDVLLMLVQNMDAVAMKRTRYFVTLHQVQKIMSFIQFTFNHQHGLLSSDKSAQRLQSFLTMCLSGFAPNSRYLILQGIVSGPHCLEQYQQLHPVNNKKPYCYMCTFGINDNAQFPATSGFLQLCTCIRLNFVMQGLSYMSQTYQYQVSQLFGNLYLYASTLLPCLDYITLHSSIQ